MKKHFRLMVGFLGLVLFCLATWQINAAKNGLEVRRLPGIQPPMVLIAPRGAVDGSRPLVLIGHGFAGSEVIMRGFAYTLAHAGYVTLSWDFDGHGANPLGLGKDVFNRDLTQNAIAANNAAQQGGFADMQRVAILGHSMGSGVALSYGQKYPGTAATIAVSPVGAQVTPSLPRSLLLMAGQLEGSFASSAEQRLAEAGGAGGDPAQGTGRKLVIIPGVEHISILFAPAAHAAARQWLDAVFGAQPGAQDYSDRCILWYGLGLLGALTAALAWIPVAPAMAEAVQRPLWRRCAALVVGGVGATLLLALAGLAGIPLSSLFSLLVGGYLLIWFGVAGALALFVLWPRLSLPGWRALGAGFLVFVALWVGMGLLGGEVWLPWLLIPRRLALWPLGSLSFLLWSLAVGEASKSARPWGKIGWWLLQSAVVVGSMLLAIQLSSGLYFVMLILPLFPLMLGAHALAAGRQSNSWAFALGAALFVSWAVLAVFPISG